MVPENAGFVQYSSIYFALIIGIGLRMGARAAALA
jgi:hypothetical protein